MTTTSGILETVITLARQKPSVIELRQAASEAVGGTYAEEPSTHARLVEATALVSVARAAHEEAIDQVIARTRVYWQGNAAVTSDDAQILGIIGEIDARLGAAQATLDNALKADSSDDATVRTAWIAAAETAAFVTTRVFDELGASATQRGKQLNWYWQATQQLASSSTTAREQTEIGRAALADRR